MGTAPATGTLVAIDGGGVAVVQQERGIVQNRYHPNYGKAWVSVRMATGTGSLWAGRFRRLFVEELTDLDALHDEALEMDADYEKEA